MHRRFSSLVRNSSAGPSSQVAEEASIYDDNESKITAVAKDEHLPVPALKVKRVDYYYSWWTKSWKYRNTSANVTIETIPIIGGGTNDIWKDFTFVIVRTVSKQENIDPSFKVVIKSGYLLKACKDVIKSWPGISWNNDPLELDPEIFIAYYPSFLQYAADLKAKTSRTTEENHVLASVNVLTSTIASDFRITLNKIDHLTSHGEITFDLLYAILVPRSVMVGRCSITGLIRLFQLASWTRTAVEGKAVFQLNLESIDLVDRPITQSVVVGRVQTTVHIRVMKGTFKIDSLDAYPLQFHPDPKGLEDMIRKRSKKWVSLIGTHHMEYDGLAAIKNGEILVKHNIRSRIMVDRAAFRRLNQNHILPIPVPPKADDVAGGANDPRFHLAAGSGVGDPRLYRPEYDEFGNYIPPPLVAAPSDTLAQQSINATPDVEISDEDLLLAPATVFGFSLSDKVWLQFNVEKIQDVDWNTDAFANLVLPGERKHLLQSLVEAHHKEIGFDDFIKDKGQGLVVNLFGPPGVGKTFSVTIHVTRSSRYPSSTFFLFFTFVHFVSSVCRPRVARA
ncbi:hypothetical protein BJ912DRAFT_451923 [Pholiota molesta]|nr:hypothetical protein BJ912DRAFT_451923 [Pholiota molesta]